MTITPSERKRLREEFEAEEKKKLSERMRKLGQSKSPRKLRAAMKSLRKAQAVRAGKP